MSAGPRAQRLHRHFVGWQCRIRGDAMRRRAGRPTPGMQPQVLSGSGAVLAPAVTVLLARHAAESFVPEFRHLARRTLDPRDRREAALALLAERYYQHARCFSGLLTATFAADSPLAAALARAGRCTLDFGQDGQRYTLPCTVARLTPGDPCREETWWHNALFNPSLPPQVPVLAFAPHWQDATATPPPKERRP